MAEQLTPEQIKAQGYTILTNPDQIKDYTIAGQYGKTGTSGSFLYGTLKEQPVKTEVGMIDTGSAIDQVNKQQSYLNSTYPAQQQPAPQPTAELEPTSTPESGKAYFTNAAGQEASYTQAQLNDPTIQQFLKDNGYVLAKSDGVNVGTDFTTSTLQKGVNEATAQVEQLAKEFMSYNVENDPDFQAQAKVIQSNFAKMAEEMKKTNDQRRRAFETLGYRTGTAQYADAIQMGIEGEELRQGNQRLADIAREEAEALSAARTAFKSGKYSEYNAKVNILKDLRDQKQQQLSDYNKAIVDFNKRMEEQRKFDFEVYKFQQEQKGKNGPEKPMVVAPGSSIFDPNTGEFIGTAPKPIDDKAPEIEKWGGMVHQWNPITRKWETVGSEDDFGGEQSGAVLDWANQVASGARKFSDVPEDLKTAVNSAMAKLPPKPADVAATQTKIDELNSLLQHKGKDRAVGAYMGSRWTPLDIDKGDYLDFIGKVEKLLSEKTLKSLIDAKAEGATFGALSEGELRILESAASTIGSWKRDSNGDGKADFYEVSEKRFNEEINRIKTEYEDLLKKTASQESSVGPVDKFNDWYANTMADGEMETVQRMLRDTNLGDTEEERKKAILEHYKVSFNMPPSTGLNGSQIGKLSANFESSGDPGAIGYDRTGGLSYGTYQLAHSNAKKFVEQSPYKQQFSGIPFNSKQWQNKWKEIARNDPAAFKQAQHDFIEKTHYGPQINKLASLGFDISTFSPVFQDVVFSTAVQHGAQTDVIEKALRKVGKNATEEQIIKAIYAERWNGGKRFASSTSAVQQAVYNRFFGKNGELKKALSMLKSYTNNIG